VTETKIGSDLRSPAVAGYLLGLAVNQLVKLGPGATRRNLKMPAIFAAITKPVRANAKTTLLP
jgi:hypothetical protein